MIEITNLVKAYDGIKGVDGLSLRVEPGQILGLVGPNGAGKTTTLRCLAGIIPATSGRITIAGFDLRHRPTEARQCLAFVPDEPYLFDHLTVRDHLTLFARLYRVDDGQAHADTLLRDAALTGRELAFPTELSRGMKQKLVVACALLHRPRVLVLDEPLTGLDPAAMRQMKRTVRQTADNGAAIIISSHMLHLVEEVCDRVLIVNQGRTVLEGTLTEIRAELPDVDADADLETLFLRATGADGGS
ncbi:MAG: ABC transporter ATP-binding protein [Acidobacteria bacterium]|mgnify:CR=1 FL=1|nr:ABC transporter ATP-binding protein [Acidobacteriota bacterium]